MNLVMQLVFVIQEYLQLLCDLHLAQAVMLSLQQMTGMLYDTCISQDTLLPLPLVPV